MNIQPTISVQKRLHKHPIRPNTRFFILSAKCYGQVIDRDTTVDCLLLQMLSCIELLFYCLHIKRVELITEYIMPHCGNFFDGNSITHFVSMSRNFLTTVLVDIFQKDQARSVALASAFICSSAVLQYAEQAWTPNVPDTTWWRCSDRGLPTETPSKKAARTISCSCFTLCGTTRLLIKGTYEYLSCVSCRDWVPQPTFRDPVVFQLVCVCACIVACAYACRAACAYRRLAADLKPRRRPRRPRGQPQAAVTLLLLLQMLLSPCCCRMCCVVFFSIVVRPAFGTPFILCNWPITVWTSVNYWLVSVLHFSCLLFCYWCCCCSNIITILLDWAWFV